MRDRKTLALILIAALFIGDAGAALAKNRLKQQQSAAETQAANNEPSEKACNRFTPPFMYNPRYMNRGFFRPSGCKKTKK